MSFPIEFVKGSGNWFDFSGVVNLAGNAAVVAVGGVTLAAIANVALTALGFSDAAVAVATAVPVALAAIAGLVGVVAFGSFVYVGVAFASALCRR